MSTALATQKVQTLKSALEKARPSIAALLPKTMQPEKLVKSALMAATVNPEILACDVRSVVLAVMHSAQLGLDCSGLLGQGYLVPFYNKRKGLKEAQFIPGYRGLVTLARRSGEIDDIYAEVVYSDDEFQLAKGDTPSLKHIPNLLSPRDDAKIVGAYMVAWLKGATRPHIEWMSRADIEKVRARSQNPGGELWDKHFAEACRKTVIRRGIKYLPLSTEDVLAVAARMEEAADEGLQSELLMDADEIEVQAEEIEEPRSRAEEVVEKIASRRGRPPKARESVTQEPIVDSGPVFAAPQGGMPSSGAPPAVDWSDTGRFQSKVAQLWKLADEKMGAQKASDAVAGILRRVNATTISSIPVPQRQLVIDLMLELTEA